MFQKRNWLFVCILVFPFSVNHAQEDTSASSLDEVVLSALRKSRDKLYVPYATESVTRKRMDQYQYRTAPEALTGMTGVFVQKTNHGGGSPFLRGLTGNQVLMLVDGIRLNNSTFRYGPNQYLNTIDAYSIGKIEVVKGTGSVQYGTDALGGVIHILTKDPSYRERKGWSGMVLGKYMNRNMEKTVRAETEYGSEKLAASIGATFRDFGDLYGGDSTGKQSPSGYWEYAYDAKVKVKLKPAMELTLAHQFLRQNHVPVYHKVVLENFALNEMSKQQRMLNYAKLLINGKSKWFEEVETIVSWQRNAEVRDSRKNNSSLLRSEEDQINTLGLTTDVYSSFTDFWTANTGIELYRDKVNSARTDVNLQNNGLSALRGLYPDGAGYGNYSLYSLHHLRFHQWQIEAGVRYNTFSISLQDSALGKVKIHPSTFVYNAAVMYHFNNRHHLYASFNTGYRAPNIDDMGTLGIVDFRYEIPASGLKPEETRTIELGYKTRGAIWHGGLSAYYMHVENLITRVRVGEDSISGYPVYKKENVEKGYIKGIEAEFGILPFTGFELTGNLAYTYGQNLTKNEPMRRIPPMHGRILARYSKGSWFSAAEWIYASKQDRLAKGDKDDNRIPAGGTPGFNVFNLFAGYRFKMLDCNIGLQNLFNEDYRTHGSGINGLGRSVWLSVKVSL